MNTWILVSLIAALLGSALVGGIFFAFSTFIMKALGSIPAAEGMRAMQSINVVVINPAFLGVFFGASIVSLALIVAFFTAESSQPMPHWFLVGAINYLAGTFLVTALGNVPLNNQLAQASADDPQGQSLWRTYLKRWTLLNHVRTAAAMLAAFCFTAGLVQY